MCTLIRNLKLSVTVNRLLVPSVCLHGVKGISTLNQINTYIRTSSRKEIQFFSESSPLLCNNYSSGKLVNCWHCGKTSEYKLSQLFCDHCSSLQIPDPKVNLFDVIGVKQTFDIDENELTKNYKNLQKQLHPDKYGRRSEKERHISEEYSSLVNKAYSTLLKPLTRGIYLLQLQGIEIPKKTDIESDFLIGIMEKNEEVENAETKEEILKLNLDNKRSMESLCNDLSAAFDTGRSNDIVTILTHLKYYVSIDNEIKKIIRKMGFIE